MATGDHPPGSEPFDVTLPEGFRTGVHRSALEAAAKQAGCTIELDECDDCAAQTSDIKRAHH